MTEHHSTQNNHSLLLSSRIGTGILTAISLSTLCCLALGIWFTLNHSVWTSLIPQSSKDFPAAFHFQLTVFLGYWSLRECPTQTPLSPSSFHLIQWKCNWISEHRGFIIKNLKEVLLGLRATLSKQQEPIFLSYLYTWLDSFSVLLQLWSNTSIME